MDILEAFDLTRCAHSAAELAGVDEKTVARYVAIRDAGGDPFTPARRARGIDPFLGKIEELVANSQGRVRADVVHQRLVAMGFTGTDRTTRRAVAEAKAAWKAGHRRKYRPWTPEPGMWMQFDWGEGPRVGGRRTQLFCAWLSWSRFRVVLPAWDQTLGTLVSCVDATLRRIGGAPTYLLTDNPRTVTMDRVAGVPVRHPEIVAAGRYYGCKVETCEPFDPESKGGAEHTVKIAKADLVPTTANLLPAYSTFADLADACVEWCERVNARTHRETGAAPDVRLATELQHLHVLPAEPHAIALGEERLVDDDQTIRFGSVRYSTPDGHQGSKVWARVTGDELVIVGDTTAGLTEIARHVLSTPGSPRIDDAHYPHHPGGNLPRPPKVRARTPEEVAFLALGEGARRWLVEAAATGVTRIRVKMARAVELAAILDAGRVDDALGLAAIAGRFAEDDLASILDHLTSSGPPSDVVVADEAHSAQPGTSGWEVFGQ
ncbi:IS21 family transposase [Amycolatopsis balhimycina DSM 5908]|uniref:IS21 family transposase n=1 Tax=Amycolatopsis balhimycina DSM 5908 TaxID=1081091 RepID=A0A428VRR7_AMYBA|nr:IS21 family transposase [Amycolatopsis balhimycina]RSM33520.1 IS21 family transposase [Amycolatopsis balhimycina DSM 5908]